MKRLIVIILLSLTMFSFFKPQETDIPSLWNRFEKWLTKKAPSLKDELNAPATKEDIARLEKLIGTELPEDYVNFLMIHNGQNRESGGLIDAEEILSTERIAEEWQVWKDLLDGGDFKGIKSEPDKGVKNDWWNSKWIPITYDGSGNHYCIDLDPNSGGTKGQIIRMWHDSPEREVIAGSFKEWMTDYINALEKGKYVYSEDYGGIINKDDL